MVAYDTRRTPDPSQVLRPATVELLRTALVEQRTSGAEPVPALIAAVHAAAAEARERGLAPEFLVVQLKALANDAGLPHDETDIEHQRVNLRRWLTTACLKAYWEHNAAD